MGLANNIILIFSYVFILCAYVVCAHMCPQVLQHMCDDQETAWKGWVYLSALRILSLELMSSSLAVDTFTC